LQFPVTYSELNKSEITILTDAHVFFNQQSNPEKRKKHDHQHGKNNPPGGRDFSLGSENLSGAARAISFIICRSNGMRFLISERLRRLKRRRIKDWILVAERLNLIDLRRFRFRLVVGDLKFVGFPRVWTRRLLFKTLDFRNLIDKKFRAAKTAKIVSEIARSTAILTLYHKRKFPDFKILKLPEQKFLRRNRQKVRQVKYTTVFVSLLHNRLNSAKENHFSS
jgi:hypothetical protein